MLKSCKVIYTSPNGDFDTYDAYEIVAPTLLGEIGVLPEHAAFVTVLSKGTLKIKTSDSVIEKEIDGGVLDVLRDNVTIAVSA